MIIYKIALVLAIIRVVTIGSEWLFVDGSFLLLGHFIAEGLILWGLISVKKYINQDKLNIEREVR